MKTPLIYLDTSVIGGVHDIEFAQVTQVLFRKLEQGRLRPVVSDVTLRELQGAPENVKHSFNEIENWDLLLLATTTEALQLADCYEKEQILTVKSRNDMLHIALATVYSVDAIVSWNFKHIVNYDKMRLFNAVNVHEGYKPLGIYSPLEFLYDD